MPAFITSMGVFLPGEPVDNDEMETVLGLVDGKPSRLRERILRANRITTRYYAMDQQQRTTHRNSALASAAVRVCLARSQIDDDQVDLLAVATTQGDLTLPGMASLVHAELGVPPCEILTTHGVCSSSFQALKAAFNQVRLGEKCNAIVAASELASRLLKHTRYEAARTQDGVACDFESEFLRWMLSDGAGAALLQPNPRACGLSLRIDWIEIISFASHFPTCMWCGLDRVGADGDSWQDYPTYADAERAGALLIRQDVRLLENMVKVGVEGFLRVSQKHGLVADDVDHFLCHYSSHHFRGKLLDLMRLSGCLIPEERWFTNLYTKGNTGCASPFIMLEELFWSDRMHVGQTVLVAVPESGRFTTAYLKMTVVNDARS